MSDGFKSLIPPTMIHTRVDEFHGFTLRLHGTGLSEEITNHMMSVRVMGELEVYLQINARTFPKAKVAKCDHVIACCHSLFHGGYTRVRESERDYYLLWDQETQSVDWFDFCPECGEELEKGVKP